MRLVILLSRCHSINMFIHPSVLRYVFSSMTCLILCLNLEKLLLRNYPILLLIRTLKTGPPGLFSQCCSGVKIKAAESKCRPPDISA